MIEDFDSAGEGQLQVQAGEIVIGLAPSLETGWTHVARLSMKEDMDHGYVPQSFLMEAPPHGIMLANFDGEQEEEVAHATKGQLVWAPWQARDGWVHVLLQDGSRGCVPETHIEWYPHPFDE